MIKEKDLMTDKTKINTRIERIMSLHTLEDPLKTRKRLRARGKKRKKNEVIKNGGKVHHLEVVAAVAAHLLPLRSQKNMRLRQIMLKEIQKTSIRMLSCFKSRLKQKNLTKTKKMQMRKKFKNKDSSKDQKKFQGKKLRCFPLHLLLSLLTDPMIILKGGTTLRRGRKDLLLKEKKNMIFSHKIEENSINVKKEEGSKDGKIKWSREKKRKL